MREATDNESVGIGRGVITVGIGITVTAMGLWGIIIASRLLSFAWSHLSDQGYPYTMGTAAYQATWWIAALCVLIAGISLIASGLKRKRYDLVPGPTLYFLGLALIVIGFFLLIYGQMTYALAAIMAGLLFVYLEWAYRIT